MDWLCAFEWCAGRESFYSGIVIQKMLFIVLACTSLSLIAVCLDRRAKWRHLSTIFCVISGVVYRILSSHWIAHRAGGLR